MNAEFVRKLPSVEEIKNMFPLPEDLKKKKEQNDREIKDIILGKSDKLLLIVGPCSADRTDAVLDYAERLRRVADRVKEKIVIVPRIYTNKPRTTGDGYKGMLHQPDPHKAPDALKGLAATRYLHLEVLKNTGFSGADEMLYPEKHAYVSDLVSYVAVGARSVENQFHRLTASALDIPVGMKNPTSGDVAVMINSIMAAQHPHDFVYAGWEVKSKGNPLAHAVLRGSANKYGRQLPNYHYEDLEALSETYLKANLLNPAIIVDTNHSNSGKRYLEQVRIAKEVMHSTRYSKTVHDMVKGLMIESYIEDGAQSDTGDIYGKSITDPCLGWEKTEKLILELGELR